MEVRCTLNFFFGVDLEPGREGLHLNVVEGKEHGGEVYFSLGWSLV